MCKGAENIKRGHRRRGFLNCTYVCLDAVAHRDEDFVLQLIDLGLGVEHQIFHLLQLRRDEAFRVSQSLFSDIIIGYEFKIRSGNLQIISENPVVAYL